MKAALLKQGRGFSDEDVNMKIVPELVKIDEPEQFYSNTLIKVGLRNKDMMKKRDKKAREDLELSVKKTKKTPLIRQKKAAADKENNQPGGFGNGMAPLRRKHGLFNNFYN